jgi:hypothetical protein
MLELGSLLLVPRAAAAHDMKKTLDTLLDRVNIPKR